MRSEAVAENNDGVETEQRVDDDDAGGPGPEEFNISGSREKEPEEEIVVASRGAVLSEKRLRTPERTPARRRRHPTVDRDSPRNRLIVDDENMLDSDDGEIVDMQFEDDSGGGGGGASASGAGGDDNSDTMVGMFTAPNIVDISEVFSPGSSCKAWRLDSQQKAVWIYSQVGTLS